MTEDNLTILKEGNEHPGLKWGPFTARIPLIHTSVAWPELLQGVFVAGATGLGLVPILQTYFELTFPEAVAFIMIQSALLCSAPILFGEPYCPGWITPALPMALLMLLAMGPDGQHVYGTGAERFQFMTAVTLNFTGLVIALGVTGLGPRMIQWLPATLKGGIIMGAAIAALKRVFHDDAEKFLLKQPVSTTVAVVLCMILTFSAPLEKYKKKYRWLRILAGLGLLPGFLAAAVIGPLVHEITYDIEWGFLIPPFAEVITKTSPLSIGWPSAMTFMDAIPLAVMGYVILFGDLITGTEMLRLAKPARPDEKIDVNFTRSHYSLAIRNGLMACCAPFFPAQGCLWTGVQVIVVQRWSQGRSVMNSLFSGISSYYVFGVPVMYLVLPLLTALKPMMGIALSLTLLLTGFACAYIAMEIPKTNVERGVVILMAMTLAFFANPWIGIIVGIVATFALVEFGATSSEPPPVREAR